MRKTISSILWIFMIYLVFFVFPQKLVFYGNTDKEPSYKQINFITVRYASDVYKQLKVYREE